MATTHAPKQGIKRKLKYVRIDDDIYFYDKKELTEFNNWLKLSWPTKKASVRTFRADRDPAFRERF